VQKLWQDPQSLWGAKNGTNILYLHAKFGGGDQWTHGNRKQKTKVLFVTLLKWALGMAH